MTVFELVAKLTLDSSEYESDLKKESESGGKLAGAWGKVGKAVAVGSAAIGAASVAVGALTKKSVAAYAEFEQLAGGVKKLYGDEASKELMGYANDAYKTAGMSANQYMEQATSFSAALVNSLNGDFSAAAKQTDVAMRAISDNFNTFGGDIQNVQNAFQGFAKQNYTMLDNLKLGYGGTKTEMERLISDANEYAQTIGMAGDLSIDSFSDIVTAIDLVQQKQGIAGATAAEAATTIEGSLNMTKAAWDNLISGLANPDADMGQLMDNLIVAIVGDKDGTGLLNQLIPAVQRAVEGIGKFIQSAVPALAKQLPALIKTFLPVAIDSIVTLVTSIAEALPDIIETLVELMPEIIGKVVSGLVTAISKAVPVLVKAAPRIVKALATGINSAMGTLLNAGVKLITSLGDAIKAKLIDVGQKAASLAKKVPEKIKSGLGNLYSVGVDLISGLWNGIMAKFNALIEAIKAKAAALPATVKKVLGIGSPSKVFAEIGKWIPAGLAKGIEGNSDVVDTAVNGMVDTNLDMGTVRGGMGAVINNYFTINGADDPEYVADVVSDKLTRNLKLGMRAI